jgi:CRP-like cAMP-binding protein
VCAAGFSTFGNRLLDSIPEGEIALLRPHLGRAVLEKDSLLHEPALDARRLYFPLTGLVSCMVSMAAGEQMEVYAAGSHDVVGLMENDELWRAKVQIRGAAVTLPRQELFSLLPRMEKFRHLLLDYLTRLTACIGQRVCCAHFHRTAGRVSLWLALASAITNRSDLECTQQAIADAIGVRRATVTVVLGELQRQGIVRCHRGHIFITDGPRLHAQTCDCFRRMHVVGRSSSGVA